MLRIKPILFLISFISCVGFYTHAQNYPVYNHYYNNQFIFNPAEAGSGNRATAFITNRQQWKGVEGAPLLYNFSIHMPFDERNVSLGANISSFKRGLLNTTDALFTYAYKVPIGDEKAIRFGLSGGIINNSVDISQIDNPDDPVVLKLINSNMQLAGKFGLKYESNGLNFGVALPQIFRQDFVYDTSFESYDLTPIDNVVIMAYYKKRVEGYFKSKKKGRSRYTKKVEAPYAPLELHMLYRYSKYYENQFEALAKLNLSQAFWVGASYRQHYGMVGNLGFNINDFSVAYAYEPASKLVTGIFSGSHEIQLSLRFGKIAGPKVKETKPDLPSRNAAPTDSKHKARYQSGESAGGSNEAFKDADGKMHIISLKSFDDFTEADNYKQSLVKRKVNAKMYVDKVTKKYHIYLFESSKMRDAKKELKRLKKNRRYRKARIITTF